MGLDEKKGVALTGELLEERDAYANRDTPATLEKVQPGRHLKLEAGHARMPSVQHLLKLDFSDDGLEFSLDAPVRRWETTQLGQTLQTLCLTTNKTQPARAVREKVNASAEEDGANHLKAERQAEGNVSFQVPRRIRYPVCHDGAKHDRDGFEHQKRATQMRWSDL